MSKAQITKKPVRVDPSEIYSPLETESPKAQKELVFRAERIQKYGFNPPERIIPILIPPKEIPKPIKQKKKALVFDIETTGLKPEETRLICIGFKDPEDEQAEPQTIYFDNEEDTLREFIRFYTNGQYNQIIGWNLKFDFTYLFHKCALYRIPAKEFFESDLKDLMQIYTQVKEAFVFGKSKNVSLDSASKEILGDEKLLSFEEMIGFWNNGEVDKVIEYNKQDVKLTYNLLVVSDFVLNVPFINQDFSPEPKVQQPEITENTKFVKIKCPNDLSEHLVPEGQEFFICPIDNVKLRVEDNLIQ